MRKMGNSDPFVRTYDFLLENAPETARDVYEGLEMFAAGLECGSEAISKLVKENSDDFARAETIIPHGKIIKELKETVSEYLAEFSAKTALDDEEKCPDDEEEKVDHATYRVNSQIPHTLSESFSHKKICAFMFEGSKYEVSAWKDALVKICELLYEENRVLFLSFLDSPAFCGRKNKYLSATSNGSPYYQKMNNADIYVWTNRSATAICGTIKTLLHCYKKPMKSLHIFLRADHTPLHTGIDPDAPISTDEKIGKYVRQTMRNFSASKFVFSPEMLRKLTDGEMTKQLFGIGIPFLKEYTREKDISQQIRDEKGRIRYWKEVFELNWKEYFIVSQWQESNRVRFDTWLNSL